MVPVIAEMPMMMVVVMVGRMVPIMLGIDILQGRHREKNGQGETATQDETAHRIPPLFTKAQTRRAALARRSNGKTVMSE